MHGGPAGRPAGRVYKWEMLTVQHLLYFKPVRATYSSFLNKENVLFSHFTPSLEQLMRIKQAYVRF